MVTLVRHNILTPIQEEGGFKHPLSKKRLTTAHADPVITTCCKKIYSKNTLVENLGNKKNIKQLCPTDGCQKPLKAEDLGLFLRYSDKHRYECNIHRLLEAHGKYENPYTKKKVRITGGRHYAVGCCTSVISFKELKNHFLKSSTDLGSCPKCHSSIDYEPLGYGYLNNTKNYLNLFENTARLTASVAIVALCLGSPMYGLLSLGIAVSSIGLGIFSLGFGKVNTEQERDEINDTSNYLLNCASITVGLGVGIAIFPFTSYFAAIACTTSLVSAITSRIIIDTQEPPLEP